MIALDLVTGIENDVVCLVLFCAKGLLVPLT
jgi:hypothetical protein